MTQQNKLIIPTREGYEFIEPEDVLYCEAAGNRCKIQIESRIIHVAKPLKHIEQQLDKSLFIRVHQSYLVNINKIVKYIKGPGGYVVVENGHELKVSESRKTEVLQRLNVI